MLQGFLTVLFVLLCFLMVLIILLQKSKGSLGILGSAGSGAQLLFGGSGGQDFFQKLTWIFIAFFMGGSLVLALLKTREASTSKYSDVVQQQQAAQLPVQLPMDAQPAEAAAAQTQPAAPMTEQVAQTTQAQPVPETKL
jgi:preprotein translocase subunit SecG